MRCQDFIEARMAVNFQTEQAIPLSQVPKLKSIPGAVEVVD